MKKNGIHFLGIIRLKTEKYYNNNNQVVIGNHGIGLEREKQLSSSYFAKSKLIQNVKKKVLNKYLNSFHLIIFVIFFNC